jgi:Fe-S cluster assembly protein SufD
MNKQPHENFLKRLKRDFSTLKDERGAIPMFATRQQAMDRLSGFGLPTRRLEAWKHTSLDALYERDLRWSHAPRDISEARLREWVDAYAPDGYRQKTIVLVDGFVAGRFLDDVNEVLTIHSLRGALDEGVGAARTPLLEEVVIENEAAQALSAAASVFFNDGVYIGAEVTDVMTDVHILHIVTGANAGTHTHTKTVCDVAPSANLGILEQIVGVEDENTWLNTSRHINLRENSSVEHIVLQRLGQDTICTSNGYISQAQDSRYRSVQCDVGGGLVRNNIVDRLREEHAEGQFFGLYFPSDRQLVDNYTVFDHVAPHCLSRELYKGVLDDNARAVFNGRVIVRQQAQKTDAYQKNNNLLLSDAAQVNTKPQLEIYADDVQCTHGATIGQIEDDAVFYLQSRGLAQEVARRMLRFAFIGEIIDEVKHEPFRALVRRVFEKRLG